MNKLTYITVCAIALLFSSCVKKNLKAEEDDNKTYDPDISLNKIYFSRDGDIYEIDPDGTDEVNITDSERLEDYPAISHDAKRIAYASGDQLFQSAIDGTDEIEITNNSIFSTQDFTPTHISWSNKSNFITFQDSKSNNKHYIDSQYDTKINKSIDKIFKDSTDHPSSYLSFSTTEDKIAFSWLDTLGDYKIGISDLEGFSGENLVFSTNGIHPVFFKDGNQLLFSWKDLKIIDIDGNNEKLLVEVTLEDIQGYSTSPDGTQIIYSSNISGNYELYILTISSGETTQLTNTPEDELHPFWN